HEAPRALARQASCRECPLSQEFSYSILPQKSRTVLDSPTPFGVYRYIKREGERADRSEPSILVILASRPCGRKRSCIQVMTPSEVRSLFHCSDRELYRGTKPSRKNGHIGIPAASLDYPGNPSATRHWPTRGRYADREAHTPHDSAATARSRGE